MRMAARDSGKDDSMRHDSARRKPGRTNLDGDSSNQSSDAVPSRRETEWLLDGLAIRPPMEEFRRIFEVKKRAFEGKVDADSQLKYEKVRKLGERYILEQQAGDESC